MEIFADTVVWGNYMAAQEMSKMSIILAIAQGPFVIT